MKSRIRSALALLVKLAIVGGVFYWLAQKNLISLSAFQRGWDNRGAILLGLGAILLANLLSGLRWQILLRSQNLLLPHSRVLKLHLIGNFFNMALPGAVSGDFVKAFYVARDLHGARAQTFGTILFDRVVGLTAVALVSVVAMLSDLALFRQSPSLRGIQTFAALAGAGVLVFYAYLFLVREKHDPILRILLKLETRFPKVNSVVRIYLGIRHYHSRPDAVLTTLGISILTQLCSGFAIFTFLHALGDTFLGIGKVYAVAPLGFLVTAIPVLPGGVGTGHAAFGFLFEVMGSRQGADAFSFYVLGQLAFGAIGGLIYLRFKATDPRGSAQLSQSIGDRETDPPPSSIPS